MGSARPGPPQVYPRPRNDLTVPDLYGDTVTGRGPRALPPPGTAGPGGGSWTPEPPSKPSARRRRQWGSDRRNARALPIGYSEPQFHSPGARQAPRVPSMAPGAPAAPAPPAGGPARRRLSLARVLVALVVAGAGYGGYLGLKTRLLTTPAVVHQAWFAPYVDVTLTPTYQFQNPADDPARQSVLGFVVAAGHSDCTPSWGGDYPLTAAEQQLAVGARIAQPYPLWSATASYPLGYKVVENGQIYQAKWSNQGVSPVTQSTDPSGSAWKALYSIPGEPSGAPAVGATAGSSPGTGPSPSPASP